jgi:3-methyl-2-oxobutanoate hydroxymethyltransferase
MVLLEAVPTVLATEITSRVAVPTIGIGAGAGCSGQVLVMHDMLNVYPGKKARFVKDYMQGASSIANAIERYVHEVKNGIFPAQEHGF